MNISDRIKSIRVSKQYSQDYMANELGISQRAYSKIENNEIKIDIEKLQKIAEIFEMEAGEILSNENNQTNNFTNNKSITNAVVNNYSKLNDELQNEIILILKKNIETLQNQITEKDKQIIELLTLVKSNN
jgi:transcriptional regulator with XRE-family HTH domain